MRDDHVDIGSGPGSSSRGGRSRLGFIVKGGKFFSFFFSLMVNLCAKSEIRFLKRAAYGEV
jgi:hypothetical protein